MPKNTRNMLRHNPGQARPKGGTEALTDALVNLVTIDTHTAKARVILHSS